MPPKQRKQRPGEEDDVFTLEAEGGVEAKKEEQLNLWDGATLKRALDEAVIEAVLDRGLAVNNIYTDLKIVLGLLACGLACLAQFYPKKYPENFWLLVGCVAGYVVLSSLMTVVATVYEKEAILITRAGSPSGAPALSISTRLPRFGDTYTLSIAPRGSPAACSSAGGSSSGGSRGGVSLSKKVGSYFHEDGYLAKEAIKQDTAQLLEQLLEAKSK